MFFVVDAAKMPAVIAILAVHTCVAGVTISIAIALTCESWHAAIYSNAEEKHDRDIAH
jgi:hypothetical protein